MAAFTSKAAGAWNTPGQVVWNEVGVPGDGDTATVSHNISSDDLTIGNSPAAGTAVLTVNSGVTLTFNAGKRLTLKGDLDQTNGFVVFGDLTNGGAHLRWDGSVVPAKYRFKTTAISQANKVTFNGTAANPCVVDVVSGTPVGCGMGVHTTTVTILFSFRATYTNFTVPGSATETNLFDLIGCGLNAVGSELYLDHCTFVGCGRRYIQEMRADVDVTVQFCKATGDTGANPFWFKSTNAPTTGLRLFQYNSVFPSGASNRSLTLEQRNGFTFRGNITDVVNTFSMQTTGSAWALWQDNIFYSRVASKQHLTGLPGDTFTKTYVFVDFPTTTATAFDLPTYSGSPVGTITYSRQIFDLVTTDLGTDGFDMPSPANGTFFYQHDYPLLLPGTAGNQAVNIIAAHGDKNASAGVNHGTLMTGISLGRASVVVGNVYLSQPGQVGGFKNTLVWAPSLPGSLGYMCEKLTTGFTLFTGTTASGTTTTLTKATGTNFPVGTNTNLADSQARVVITTQTGSGPPVGETRPITANTTTQITVSPAFSVSPDTGSNYAIHTVDAITAANVSNNAVFNVNSGTVYDAIGGTPTAKLGFEGWWLTDPAGFATDTINLGTGAYTGLNGPMFRDITRNMYTFDRAYLGNTSTAAWADATVYAVGDVVAAQTSGFYGNVLVNYICITAHTSNAANGTNGKPGSAASFRTNWECASISRIRDAMLSGATITDATLGLSGATYIQALHAWVTAGFAPAATALRGAASDGGDIGAVAFSAAATAGRSPSRTRRPKMFTSARPFQKARLANSSSADFPTWVTSELLAQTAFDDPNSAAGRVITRLAVQGGNGLVPCAIQVMPYGLGSDNDVFSLRIVGLRRIAIPLSDGRHQFVREKIAVLACTISQAVGFAGGAVLNTERFADTISITFEATYTADVTRTGTIQLYSPADNTPANAIVPLIGYEAIEFEWDQTTGTPTMNALLSFISGTF